MISRRSTLQIAPKPAARTSRRRRSSSPRERADALAKEFDGRVGKVVSARLEKLCDSCCHIFINTTKLVENKVQVQNPGCTGCGVCQYSCPTYPKSITVAPKAALNLPTNDIPPYGTD